MKRKNPGRRENSSRKCGDQGRARHGRIKNTFEVKIAEKEQYNGEKSRT